MWKKKVAKSSGGKEMSTTETRNSGSWSELPRDLLASIFNRLSFADFHRAKIVCSNWNLGSKQTVLRRSKSPWLMLFPEGEDGCALYNPEEDRIYRTDRDFSGIRFIANSGNWFLVLDSRSTLYIIDVFSDKRIYLPPLESHHLFKETKCEVTSDVCARLRGVMWVNEKNEEEYVVVWFFEYKCDYEDHHKHLAFCKNGEDHYTEIPTWFGVGWQLNGVSDIVLRGYILYVLTLKKCIRILDFSGKQGFKDVVASDTFPIYPSGFDATTLETIVELTSNIAVTTSGEVLFVLSILYQTSHRVFSLYKKDPNHHLLVEVDSLGDEALLMDLGITVSGIKPNSIYFTPHDRVYQLNRCMDISLFNHATKTLKRFPCLSNLKLKDARWFLPSFGGT